MIHDTHSTAGSETLSSFFTAAMYLLGTHPEAYHRLKDEIRNEYTDIQAINAVNTQKLQYLNAVIEECLRVVPPISLGLPRYSPGAEVDGIYLPPGVSLIACTHFIAKLADCLMPYIDRGVYASFRCCT